MTRRIPGAEEYEKKLKDKEFRESADVKYVKERSKPNTGSINTGARQDYLYWLGEVEHRKLRRKALKLMKPDFGHVLRRVLLSLSIFGLMAMGAKKIKNPDTHLVSRPVPTETVDPFTNDYYYYKTVREVDQEATFGYLYILVVVAVIILFVFWILEADSFTKPERRKEFNRAVRGILSIEGLKEKDGFEDFMKWAENNEDMKETAYALIQKCSKKDRAYIDNLLNGGLDNANFATAIAIIIGHLESHPEFYPKLIQIIDESDLPGTIKAKYGNTLVLAWGNALESEYSAYYVQDEYDPDKARAAKFRGKTVDLKKALSKKNGETPIVFKLKRAGRNMLPL